MSSLYFYYSSMDSGKSTYLLQAAHNYRAAGKNVLLMTPNIDERFGKHKIVSRIGLESDALGISSEDDLFSLIREEHNKNRLSCVMIDEIQFLQEKQIWSLSDVVDVLSIPILCFGLRTDAFGCLFSGSQILLGLADELREIKSICRHCDKKATMQYRIRETGEPVLSGEQIEIGGNERYVAVCRRHYKNFVRRSFRKE